mgnify:CR=1 FL=1
MANINNTLGDQVIIRESATRTPRHNITVLELDSGDVILYAFDRRAGFQEVIALREYIDAYEIYYDFDEGGMANGQEIPYKDIF